MLKENKGKLILSSLLILSPVFAGFLMWNQLPDTMAVHWGLDGAADGYGTKLFSITVPFLILLAVHWFFLFFTGRDKGNENQNIKVKNMLFWIIPVISISMGGFFYCFSSGKEMNSILIICMFTGILFILIGNYLPKCTQNITIGIKIPWTLKNEENWNATHRFAGKVWFFGGFLYLIAGMLPNKIAHIIFLAGIFVLVAVPVLYSYFYYRKQLKEERWTVTRGIYDEKYMKTGTRISLIILIPLLIFVGILMFSGEIEYVIGEESFSIEADFWSDATIKYENIESIEYREEFEAGFRASGFGSARLGMGTFENDQLGYYTRYCYEKCDAGIVMKVGNRHLVVNCSDEEETIKLFDALCEKCRELE